MGRGGGDGEEKLKGGEDEKKIENKNKKTKNKDYCTTALENK